MLSVPPTQLRGAAMRRSCIVHGMRDAALSAVVPAEHRSQSSVRPPGGGDLPGTTLPAAADPKPSASTPSREFGGA